MEPGGLRTSIEYALAELKTPLIVVLGHTNCGAVGAALKGKEQPSDNLKLLVSLIHTGGDLPKDKDAALDAAVRNNVQHQTQLLTKQSKIIKDFADSGRVKVVPAVYDLEVRCGELAGRCQVNERSGCRGCCVVKLLHNRAAGLRMGAHRLRQGRRRVAIVTSLFDYPLTAAASAAGCGGSFISSRRAWAIGDSPIVP